jgi:hypothetical protein
MFKGKHQLYIIEELYLKNKTDVELGNSKKLGFLFGIIQFGPFDQKWKLENNLKYKK